MILPIHNQHFKEWKYRSALQNSEENTNKPQYASIRFYNYLPQNIKSLKSNINNFNTHLRITPCNIHPIHKQEFYTLNDTNQAVAKLKNLPLFSIHYLPILTNRALLRKNCNLPPSSLKDSGGEEEGKKWLALIFSRK